jgi:hypothetical protein
MAFARRIIVVALAVAAIAAPAALAQPNRLAPSPASTRAVLVPAALHLTGPSERAAQTESAREAAPIATTTDGFSYGDAAIGAGVAAAAAAMIAAGALARRRRESSSRRTPPSPLIG